MLMSISTSPSPGLHDALVSLQRATLRDRIVMDAAMRNILSRLTSSQGSRVDWKLGVVVSLPGPVRCVEEAADVFQEVGLLIWRNCHSYRGKDEDDAKAWALAIVRNRTQDIIRKVLRRQKKFKPVEEGVRRILAMKKRAKVRTSEE
jgi:DNA-directed RNA polymerase specialized sigma24 family protein